MMKIKEQLGISIALQLFVIILLIFKMSAAYLRVCQGACEGISVNP